MILGDSMKKISKLFLFGILCFFSLSGTILALAPQSGSFNCTYEMPYTDTIRGNFNLTMKASYSDGNLRFDFPQTAKDSPASYYANKKDPNYSANYVNRLITDNFSTNKGTEWKCPKISYQINDDGNGVYIIMVDTINAGLEKTVSPSSTSYNQPTAAEKNEAESNNITTCPQFSSSGKNVSIAIDNNTNIGTVYVNSSITNKINNISSCPKISELNYCENYIDGKIAVVYKQTCYEYASSNGFPTDIWHKYSLDHGSYTTTDADGNDTTTTGGAGNKLSPEYSGIVVDKTCEGILGNGEFLQMLKDIFGYIQVLGPLLALVLGMVDFTKAAMSGEDDAKKKALKDVKNRLIAAFLLFLIPFVINLLLSLAPGLSGDCNLGSW